MRHFAVIQERTPTACCTSLAASTLSDGEIEAAALSAFWMPQPSSKL
jgi:hypothetical protein